MPDAEKNPTLQIPEELIAPCGMNCAICSRYLAFKNNLKRSQCVGCRPRNQKCAYLFGKCTGINNTIAGDAVFCYECEHYPCKQITRMDERYRTNYKMSIKDNLADIRENGLGAFIKEQYRKYQCHGCGGLISIHNGKRFKCDTITKLVDKNNKSD